MGSLEARRDGIVARLAGAYGEGLLDTGTFERRLDDALRAQSAPALHAADWDLPDAWDGLRLAAARLRLALDAAAGRIAPPEAVQVVDLRPWASGPRRAPLVLGRSSHCDIVVPGSDSVSRRHAELSLRAGVWTLRDLGSTNGTWVGARRVAHVRLDGRVPVRAGRLELRWAGV